MENLKNIGVSILDSEEIKNVKGGGPWWPFVFAYFILESAANPQSSVDAFMEGFNSTQKR
jgi:hypothetical protein